MDGAAARIEEHDGHTGAHQQVLPLHRPLWIGAWPTGASESERGAEVRIVDAQSVHGFAPPAAPDAVAAWLAAQYARR